MTSHIRTLTHIFPKNILSYLSNLICRQLFSHHIISENKHFHQCLHHHHRIKLVFLGLKISQFSSSFIFIFHEHFRTNDIECPHTNFYGYFVKKDQKLKLAKYILTPHWTCFKYSRFCPLTLISHLLRMNNHCETLRGNVGSKMDKYVN